ncbi:6033_t:CDS:2, partial [Gigaspora rosea]
IGFSQGLFETVVYLAAYKTKCHFKKNGIQCTGTPVLRRLRRYDNILPSYFIGCSNWRDQEKFHRIEYHLLYEHVYKELIRQADDNTTDITPTQILTENLIKTYFGTEYLVNIHASLNNTDHLRYYVDNIQKRTPSRTSCDDMLALLTAKSENEINELFDKIENIEKMTDWGLFYRQKWVIVLLNKCMSQIDKETWILSPSNTNVAESAHALSNRCRKNLKLIERKLNQEKFIAINIHQKYNVSSHG